MKKIKLKGNAVELKQLKMDGQSLVHLSDTATYADLIMTVLNKPIQNGTVDEQRKVCKVMDVLDEAHDFLLLEDEDWNILKSRVEKFTWAFVSREILKFCDAILKAEETQVKEVPQKEASG